MKRPEYVAAATACCRAALEERHDDALDRVVRDVFSRSGFTDGYYQGALGADMFGVRTKDDATASKDTFSYIHSLYRNERQSVGVSFFAEIKRGEKILVTATDNKGASVSVSGAVPESAKRRDTDEAEVKAALSKLGGTPYFAESITVMLDGGLFVSAAALNDIRREAVAGLSKKRGAAAREVAADYSPMQTKKRTPGTPLVYARFCSADAVPDNLSGVNTVILPLDCDFSGLPHNVNKAAELPRYITDEGKTLSRLEALKRAGVTAAYCGNLAAIYLAKRTGLRVICSNGLNCASSESARALSEAGADGVILSAEINIAAAKDFCDEIPIGIFAYGRLPLMLTRNCPVKNAKSCRECGKNSALRDRKGVLFPVTCRCGYSEVLNSTPIYLADKKDDLCVFDFMLLYFSDESKDKAREIIDCYLCSRAPDDGFTRGLYYKNLP